MFLASAVVFLSLSQATAIDTDIYFAEEKSGSNHFEQKADKSIDSVSHLKVQGFNIDSHITISFIDDKPVAMTFDESMKQGTKVVKHGTMTVKDGKAIVVSADGATPVSIDVQLAMPFFASFHPQLVAPLYSNIHWANKTTQDSPIFLVEAAKSLDVHVTPQDEKAIDVDGVKIQIRFATVVLGAVTARMVFGEHGQYIGMDVAAQKLRMVRRGYEKAFEDSLAKFPELSQSTFTAKTSQIDIPLRDGIVTKAVISQPTNPGKYPVILARTPYGRMLADSEGEYYAKRGYVYIVQDVRGTGDSKGIFDPFTTESKDGYDTIDWISKQSWCDGGVGMIGGSYGGFVQWAAAVERHPALKCLVPQVSPPSSAMWNLPYENGVLSLFPDLWWLRLVDNPKGQNMLAAFDNLSNMKALTTLPLNKIDEKFLGFHSKVFTIWLERDGSTKWPGWDFDSLMPKVTIPALNISGWFDGDEIGTQRNWQFLREGGNTNQWLIYGPWVHAFNTTSSIGNIDFGKDAILELDSLYLRWFDTWLKGKHVGIEKLPKVKYFAMGENKWHESKDWPPVESKEEVLKFQFGTINAGPTTQAKLLSSLTKDTSAKSDYDPSKEEIGVDSVDIKDKGNSQDMYIKDSTIPKDRITLLSEPLDHDRLVTGPVSVEFDFKSSAHDTDFYALVLDQDPVKGSVAVFRNGKVKASYIGGLDKQRFITPGKTYRAKLQLWDAANTFKKGHRMMVMIMQSMFPSTARNLGTTEPILTGTKMVTQHNVIYSTRKNPGLIRFRVID